MDKILEQNIRLQLSMLHLTQREFADRLGVTQATISRWMNGKKAPTIAHIDLMCKVLGCTRRELLYPQTEESVKQMREHEALTDKVMHLTDEGVSLVLNYINSLNDRYFV